MECVQYLLEQGADPCAETETGDNCLHVAAKNGYSECLHRILEATVTIGSGEPTRLADTVIPYHIPVKFVDIRNSEKPFFYSGLSNPQPVDLVLWVEMYSSRLQG